MPETFALKYHSAPGPTWHSTHLTRAWGESGVRRGLGLHDRVAKLPAECHRLRGLVGLVAYQRAEEEDQEAHRSEGEVETPLAGLVEMQDGEGGEIGPALAQAAEAQSAPAGSRLSPRMRNAGKMKNVRIP